MTVLFLFIVLFNFSSVKSNHVFEQIQFPSKQNHYLPQLTNSFPPSCLLYVCKCIASAFLYTWLGSKGCRAVGMALICLPQAERSEGETHTLLSLCCCHAGSSCPACRDLLATQVTHNKAPASCFNKTKPRLLQRERAPHTCCTQLSWCQQTLILLPPREIRDC